MLQSLGSAVVDLEEITSTTPAAARAWSALETQITAEGGALDGTLHAAEKKFVDQFDSITKSGVPFIPEEAASAAAAAVRGTDTIVGAVENIGHLVSAARGGVPPAETIQLVTGTMLAALVSTGVATAGVGAAVMAGLGAAMTLMKAAGLFGDPPRGVEICGGVHVDPPPPFVVGCVAPAGCSGEGMYGGVPCQIQPGSDLWRNFPDPQRQADAAWFSTGSAYDMGVKVFLWGPGQPISWTSPYVGRPGVNGNPRGVRPIDVAFPEYPQLEAEQRHYGPDDFRTAYFAAWKMNRAYALNGLKPQKDQDVLRHVLGTWNRAHEGTSVAIVKASYERPLGWQDVDNTGSGRASYVSMLVGIDGKRELAINTGPRRVPIDGVAVARASAAAAASVAAQAARRARDLAIVKARQEAAVRDEAFIAASFKAVDDAHVRDVLAAQRRAVAMVAASSNRKKAATVAAIAALAVAWKTGALGAIVRKIRV
jgi:hypothetical protein